ncbi:cytochrome c oxidase subunit 3 family protein [Mycobacterium marseillense]|jgi:nitric oxide reductase NorE protein|uniref:Probable cytochrome c oxidase subunit 3 n=1 Tax=Mycobacterium marseillense TaxID=701042 RepID=A0AAC9VSE7_9MYCO|nr:cytochrome c oxidase subunit 3 family protein [Mycobacterium marseillense]ASW89180.1 cytochrome C oxidase subunit III [Mycobacterium marseillense]MCA2261808.1 cytochrome c oxidase subunit 3 family protein [Mycobacterium marseillense]MCV7406559.1 cytochrome c oxidase subunit 3 family protein [Mycobacterium marseillense]OBJ77816.1 cytochrome C oxidase subunit III [Mycobacterium marseillense]ORA96289.1 cytochrome C oxidase subunit III [Mycobacterium marseillense]
MTDLAERNKRAVPGQPDMWAFVLFETLVFTAYFGFYLFYRARHAELFLHSQAQLDLRIGVFNTLVLLLSSWSVARCVQSARAGAYRAALKDVYITAAFAAVFLFFKVFEWARLVGIGSGFDSNDFFTYYFFLTGIHFVHLLIGFVALGVIVYQIHRAARKTQEPNEAQQLVETCATYWHTVDFLWVLIFALLYVVR